jgi:hypothetical protein
MGSMRFLATLLIPLCLLAGCSSTSTYSPPGVDLDKYKHIWVEQNLADDHGVNEMIAAELRTFGYEVGTGPSTMMPRGIEAVVTYSDDWAWDFKTYMIDIEVTMRELRSPRIITKARYFRPGITNKSPEAMVHAVMQAAFKEKKK